MKTRGHLTTGFVGTPYLCHVLSRYGYTDVAYLLLNREEYPSWLYPVKQGATTIWERWDGQKPDGTFQDVGMNSFNHYAYGAIGEWMYRVVAGLEIDPREPGYKHVLVQPQPGGGLTSAEARLADALRRGGVRLGAGGRQGDRLGHGAAQRARHGPPARGDAGRGDRRRARGGDGAGREARRAGRRRRRGRGGLGALPVRLRRRRGSRRDSTRRGGSAPGRPSRPSSRAPRPGRCSTSAYRASPRTPGSSRPSG